MRLYTALTSLALLPLLAQASVNSFYFSFPSKTATVPLVHNGDVLNITWFSQYTQAYLEFWCGSTLMDRIPGLSGDGHAVYTANTTWTDSCHWQLVQQGDADRYVDSGVVDVTNAKASPAALTWKPAASAESACAAAASTVTAAAATATATVTAAADAAASSLAEEECEKPPAMGTGASMGVGVAIGAAVTGVAGAVGMALLRRRWRRSGEGSGAVQQMDACKAADGSAQQRWPVVVHELNPTDAYVEADSGTWGNRKRYTPVELPHSPGLR